MIRLAVLIQYRLVTDGQKDTSGHTIYCASIVSRGINCLYCKYTLLYYNTIMSQSSVNELLD